jgi:hypothetical protein
VRQLVDRLRYEEGRRHGMAVAGSDEERWAQTSVDRCSGGAAPGSSSLAMELTARSEELGSLECDISSVRHAARERASSGSPLVSARVEERRRKLPSKKGTTGAGSRGTGSRQRGLVCRRGTMPKPVEASDVLKGP